MFAAVEYRLGDPIVGQEAYRTQLLAVFLQDRYPEKASIAPYISHMRNATCVQCSHSPCH